MSTNKMYILFTTVDGTDNQKKKNKAPPFLSPFILFFASLFFLVFLLELPSCRIVFVLCRRRLF